MENENTFENEFTPDDIDDKNSVEELNDETEFSESDAAETVDNEKQSEDCEAAEACNEDFELTEEELTTIRERKRKRVKIGIVISVAVAVMIAVAAYFICTVEGIGSGTIVETPISSAEEDTSVFKRDNIKYENPLVAAFDKITGKNQNIALTISGEKVDRDLFNFVVNSSGVNSVYTLIQMQMLTNLDDFNWNDIEETSRLSYLEVSKGMAVETLIPIYAVIAEGKKHGINLDEDDEKNISDWIAEQKANYGDRFEEVLKKSGYENEETLAEIQRIQVYMQKVYADISDDVTKYVPAKMYEQLSDEKVTVKHILVEFEKDEQGNVSDEAKAAAKKEAEEVLAKVKAGEDFDKLIEQYNDDPGATDEGYTFANDGSMVQEFADASFALEIGDVSELVETPYGYHIIKRLERAVTADEYIEMLQKNAEVRVKKGVFDKMTVTINLEDYFGTPQTEESTEAEEGTE